MKRAAVLIATLAAAFVIATPAFAHPLGNFTINQHVGIDAVGGELRITHVVDMAEIPAFQAIADIDTDGDNILTASELEQYATITCATVRKGLGVVVGGTVADPTAGTSTAVRLPGQGGLETMRIECGSTVADVVAGVSVAIVNSAYADSLGWTEIVVRGGSGDVRTESPSGVLRTYPDRGATLDEREAAFVVSGAVIVASADESVTVASVSGPGALIANVLGGATGIGAVLLGLVAAFALGAGHALAPGHGKALMAAYLVGNQGTARHATLLGLAVAVSHTIGVAALGLVTLGASAAFRPEQVYPYLSAISAVIILGLGGWLAIRAYRRLRGQGHAHGHDHGHSHDHDHDHGHSHGLQPGQTIGWKSLAALGLSGGLVPSTSAVVLFLGALNLGRIDIGLLMVALFGIGMSTSLVLVGITVVRAEKAGRKFLAGRTRLAVISRFVPAAAAVAVLVVGTVMTINAVGGLVT